MNKNAPLYEVRHIENLKDMLNQSRELYADSTAFLIKKKTGEPYSPVTYRQFAEDVDALGTAFADLGIQGQRVAILAESRYEWYVTYLATVNGIGITVPLDKELPVAEVCSLMSRSKAGTLVYAPSKQEIADTIRAEVPGVEHFVRMGEDAAGDSLSFTALLEKGRALLKQGDTRFTDAKIDNEAMSILLFTSGTTAQSKAVMLSHKNICANLEGMCSMTYIGPDDIFLSVLPLHHTYECTCGFLCPIYRGSSIAQCEGLRYIVQNMQESKTSIMLVVPLMLELFHRNIMKKAKVDAAATRKFTFAVGLTRGLRKFGVDLRRKLFHQVHESFGGHLRLLVSGGAAIDPVIMRDLQDLGLHCIQGYGLTECAPILALNRDVYYKNQSAGLPLPSVVMDVVNKDENGIGEIIGRGPNVMLGYYENDEATADVLQDGWFHTGDLGYIDDDGFVIITGRKKNVIITKNGKNVFPEEIEGLLARSPYITESLVAGKENSQKTDIEIVADIYPDAEAIVERLGPDPDSDAIRTLIADVVSDVNSQMVTYKRIHHFTIREEEFEKTTSRKIKRTYTD